MNEATRSLVSDRNSPKQVNSESYSSDVVISNRCFWCCVNATSHVSETMTMTVLTQYINQIYTFLDLFIYPFMNSRSCSMIWASLIDKMATQKENRGGFKSVYTCFVNCVRTSIPLRY
ncbi:hypothetical protein HW555_007459 [Spodoptera exigua]|uniref:Uncharacterized protein n=1 Tax=Spodoptera exigua TaxID=7107 RepID=A0A835L3L9_SPOEX|nr:hypothetical protein HW555_007459 [Spodoptera exigua]